MSSSRRRRWYWLGLAVSVLATLYCFSGFVMNAHFSMMESDGHMLAAKIFAALTYVGLVLSLFCVVMLWRARPSRPAI